MLTRPSWIGDDDVAAALHVGWRVDVDLIAYAPVGFGSHHWHVHAGDERWFVTLDDLVAKRTRHDEPLDESFARLRAALTTAHTLRAAGHEFVVAPEPDAGGDVVLRLDERTALAVYPHVDGRTHGWGPYESSDERAAIVQLLAALHGSGVTCRRAARTETFALPNLDVLLAALGELDKSWSTGPFAEPARRLLIDHHDAVTGLIERHAALARTQQDEAERFVLTHGEPHRGNTITTTTGIAIVDWDTALIAPPERDLWRLVDEEPDAARWYEQRTGTLLDPEAVELYPAAWDLADVAISTSVLFHEHPDSDDNRAALANLRSVLG